MWSLLAERNKQQRSFKVTKTRCLTDDIKCRRMRWLGHVFRMEPDRTAKISPKVDSSWKEKTWETKNNLASHNNNRTRRKPSHLRRSAKQG